jgi:hypothetical protein
MRRYRATEDARLDSLFVPLDDVWVAYTRGTGVATGLAQRAALAE